MSLVLALLACYGTLAALALLAALGFGITLADVPWAGPTSAIIAILTGIIVMAGMRRHHSMLPSLVAVPGAVLVAYALLVDFNAMVELAGFVLLAIAVAWDTWLRRRHDALSRDATAHPLAGWVGETVALLQGHPDPPLHRRELERILDDRQHRPPRFGRGARIRSVLRRR